MASPLSFFRKHQYVALVAVGVLAIVSFVIIPPIDEYLRSRSGVGGPQRQAVVVTWSQGRVREMDLRNMETNHHLTMNFLDAMAEEVQRRDGQPKAMRLFRNSSEQALIATMLLAEKAEQLGVVISDSAIHDYLDRFADGLFDHRDLNDILRSSTSGRLTRVSLFKQLRRELLAHYMRQMVFTGVAATTPAADFQHFNQLRERMTLELLPLPVSEFVAKVETQPTESDLRQLYEAHQDDYKSPMRADPGFRRLPKIDFAYFKVDFNTFLEQEKQNITEAEILREYEAGKQSGEYRRASRPSPGSSPFPDIPGFPSFSPDDDDFPFDPEAAEEGDLPETTPETTPEVTPPETATPEEATTEEGVPEEAPSEEAAPEDTTSEDPTPEDSAPEEPASEEPASEEGDESPRPESPQESQESQSESEENGTDCAPFFQDDEPADEPDTSEAEPVEESPAESSEQPEAPESDQPEPETSEPESPEPESAETEAAEPEPADEDSAAEEAESQEAPAEEEVVEVEMAEEEPVSEFLTLEEAREQILRKLASPAAQQRLEEAMNEARAELEGYFQAYTIWKQQIEFARTEREREREPEPAPPDFDALADRLGFAYGRTGLVDIFEVSDTELGETARFDAMTRSIRSFAQIAFDEDVPLFRVREIGSNVESGVDFLYWKADEQDEYTPPFDEIRVEVEEAWKVLEARKLADERVKELQKIATERPGPLKESLPDYADQVFQTNEFTWLSTGNMGFNPFAQPTLGNVEGVEGVSWEFMESVFQLKEEEVGTARNGPEDTFFVVRVVRRAPTDERQRQEFLQAFRMGGLQDIFPLQQDEQRAYYQRWFQDLEEEMNVTWQRPADQFAR